MPHSIVSGIAGNASGYAIPSAHHGPLVNSGSGALASSSVYPTTITPILAARWILVQQQRLESVAASLENRNPGILAAAASGPQQTDQDVDVDIEMPDVGSEFAINREAAQFLHDIGIDPRRLAAGTVVARFLEWAAALWLSGGGPMEGVTVHQ